MAASAPGDYTLLLEPQTQQHRVPCRVWPLGLCAHLTAGEDEHGCCATAIYLLKVLGSERGTGSKDQISCVGIALPFE